MKVEQLKPELKNDGFVKLCVLCCKKKAGGLPCPWASHVTMVEFDGDKQRDPALNLKICKKDPIKILCKSVFFADVEMIKGEIQNRLIFERGKKNV